MTRLSSQFASALARYGAPRAAQRLPKPAPITPEQEESIARKAARLGLGGIGVLGNLLDLPASMVRDVVVGENPWDQLAHPASNINRVGGREVLERWGLLGANKPGLDWGDVAGLTAGVAMDPLLWLSGPIGSLTKAGRAAEAAGALEGVAEKGGQWLGRRLGRATTTLEEALHPSRFASAEAATAAREAAAKAATKMGTSLEELLPQKLGGAMSIGLPFSRRRAVWNPQRLQPLLHRADVVGRAIRYGRYSPVRPAAALFGTKTMGAWTERGQKEASKLLDEQSRAVSQFESDLAPALENVARTGWFEPEAIAGESLRGKTLSGKAGRELRRQAQQAAHKEVVRRWDKARRYVEGIDKELDAPEPVRKAMDSMRKALRDRKDMEQFVGLKSPTLDEIVAEYFPRDPYRFPVTPRRGRGVKGYSGWARDRAFATSFPYETGRREFLKHHGGGTSVIQELSMDPNVSGYAWNFANGKLDKESLEYVRRYITQNYVKAGKIAFGDEPGLDRLARFVARLDPRHAELGIPFYEPNLFKSFINRMRHGIKAQKATERVIRILSEEASPLGTEFSEGSERLSDILRSMGLTDQADARALKLLKANPRLKDLLTHPTKEALDHLYVSKELADDVRRYIRSFTQPEEVQKALRMVDYVTNLFRSSVTLLWPAFHVRNLVSGQYRNLIGGAWDAKSLLDARDILWGKTAKGLAKATGLDMSDEEATRHWAQRAWAEGLIGARHRQAESMMEGARFGMPEIPGLSRTPGWRIPLTPAPVGTTPLQRANPLLQAGVGAEKTVFTPARLGTDVSAAVEGLNRLTPFLNLVKKGWDPHEAAKRVNLLQIDYTAKATLDPAMRRLAPFWSFLRGNIPFVAEELTTRPGGPLGQTIRIASTLRSPSALVPDYVAETASIPLGTLPGGSKRYLTGGGFMFEDPLSFLGNGFKGAGLEFLSRTNPMFVKGPLEYITGQSFFQKGPYGGRPLSKLDPAIGRTISNIRQLAKQPSLIWRGGSTERVPPAEIPGGRSVEQIISNSPLTRFVTTARVLTDPRKSLLAKAVALGTGFRYADISPAQRDQILRLRSSQLMERLKARRFTRIYIPKDEIAKMPPEEAEAARSLNALHRVIARRAQVRAQQRRLSP